MFWIHLLPDPQSFDGPLTRAHARYQRLAWSRTDWENILGKRFFFALFLGLRHQFQDRKPSIEISN